MKRKARIGLCTASGALAAAAGMTVHVVNNASSAELTALVGTALIAAAVLGGATAGLGVGLMISGPGQTEGNGSASGNK